jgi:hypothetical protein
VTGGGQQSFLVFVDLAHLILSLTLREKIGKKAAAAPPRS